MLLDSLYNMFLAHPRSLGISYTEHALGSLGIATHFGAAAWKAVVHAAVPGLYTTSSTEAIECTLPKELAALRRSSNH